MNEYYYNFSQKKGKIDYADEAKKSGKTIASSTVGGAKSAGPIGAIIGAVVGIVNSGFSWGRAVKDKKRQDEVFREELLDEIFNEKKKTNYVPIIVVGSILLVGGVVTYFALKE